MKTLIKKTFPLILSTFILFFVTACNFQPIQSCSHQWLSPTCTKPKTCSICNATEGEPWGHVWLEAACTTPKTCSTCSATEGTALGHNTDNWTEWKVDYYDAVYTRELICSKCEEVVETQESPITSFVNGNYFSIHSYAFANRFEESSSRLNGVDFGIKSEYAYDTPIYSEDNYVYYRIQDKNYNYVDVGMMSFTTPNGETISTINNFSKNSFDCINILIAHSYDVSAVVYTAILAIDPNIGYSEAADVGQKIVDSIAIYIGDINEEDFQGINYNGINYLLFRDSEYHYLIISII